VAARRDLGGGALDHEEAGAPMSGRGWLAVAIAVVAVLGAGAAARTGAAPAGRGVAGSAVSSVWVCPHGGGDGWTGNVVIANPGTAPIDAQVTALGGRAASAIDTVTVDPGSERVVAARVTTRAAATAVEVFGGHAAVGWTVHAWGADSGTGAEPCTETPGTSWSVVDGVTNRQTRSYLIVTNPFASDAVVDVVLYLSGKPPVRDPDWTDLRVRADSSIALDLRHVLGEPIVGATVSATRGRVAVSSLAVGVRSGVRSALAVPAFASRWIAPAIGGTDAATLSLLVPGDLGVRYSATELSQDTDAHPAGNLTVAQQGGASTISNPVTTAGASAIVLQVTDGGPVAVGLRVAGKGSDPAATSGTSSSADAWVALPAAIGPAAAPSVVVVNDGAEEVTVTARRLPDGGGDAGDATTVTIAPGRAAALPRAWLDEDPSAAVLLTGDHPFVALSAATVGRSAEGYALALAVPVPADATGAP
jgi:hypothetical protein